MIPIANLNSLIVNGVSRFLNPINGNITGTASNVTGTVAIANGGTGATTRLGAAQALTNEAVATPGYIVGLTSNWAKFGYTSIDQLKTTIGSASASSGGTAITMVTTGEKYTWNNKSNLTIGTTATTAMAGNTTVTNVTQTATNADAYYEVLMSATADNTSRAEATRKCPNILIRPYNDEPILRVKPSSGNDKVDIIPGIVDVYNASSKYIRISGTDLTLGGTSNTWDGTNTSLVTAVTNKLDKSGGTMTGTIITPADNSKGIRPATNNRGELGDPSYWYNRTYCNNIYTSLMMACDDLSTASSISTVGKLVMASDDIYFADGTTQRTWDGTNTSLKTALGNKISDIKIIKVNVLCTQITQNMSLASYVTSSLPSGYTFLGWQACGASNGWVSTFPIYIANCLSSAGGVWWQGTLNTNTGCGVDFYYFAIKK